MRVLIVDEKPIFRKGLYCIIKGLDGNYDVFEHDTISDVSEIITKYEIDLLIVNLELGYSNDINMTNVIDEFKHGNDKLKTIAFVSDKNIFNHRKLSLTTEGIIYENADIEDIEYAVGLVARGGKYIDPKMMSKISGDNLLNKLTSREYDVLMEVKAGLCNQAIAQKLYISEGTVKKHISNILSKLNLNSRVELALHTYRIEYSA